MPIELKDSLVAVKRVLAIWIDRKGRESARECWSCLIKVEGRKGDKSNGIKLSSK